MKTNPSVFIVVHSNGMPSSFSPLFFFLSVFNPLNFNPQELPKQLFENRRTEKSFDMFFFFFRETNLSFFYRQPTFQHFKRLNNFTFHLTFVFSIHFFELLFERGETSIISSRRGKFVVPSFSIARVREGETRCRWEKRGFTASVIVYSA